ncbi:S41 family peptidase [Lichenicoccus sp.]|uniref:S41 family peptidase n=1 Tax=Lichenicoccus sp. TaxID=2781899 RepID=UPI003D0F47C7
MLLLLWVPEPAISAGGFDAPLFSSVVGEALDFLGPRTLEPASPRQFVLWGLNGLAAIDPSFTVDTRANLVRLVMPQRVLLEVRAPAAADLAGWTRTAVAFAAAGWDASPTIRAAGQQALLQSFFDELFNHLDPYSRYIAPTQANSDRDNREGGIAGPGITIGHMAMIAAVNANGPAFQAGIQAGQHLLAVDGHATRARDRATIARWLEGAEGSMVSLIVSNQGGRAQTIRLIRARVPPETVFAFSSGDIVVLRVTGFSNDTAQEISEFLDQVMQPGGTPVRGLVFDLRGNRGGLLQQAVTSVALVLDRGVAVTTQGRAARSNHIWSVRGGDLTRGLPLVVLVDGRTASAAEIMAAALADHRRAIVVGSATLGKGLVQVIAQLPDGGELFVTWSRVIAPDGWPLQGLGVMPELCTSLGQSALDRALDDLADGILDNARAVRQSRLARAPLPMARILEIRDACPAAIGTDVDLAAARVLIDDPTRYQAALVPAAVHP